MENRPLYPQIEECGPQAPLLFSDTSTRSSPHRYIGPGPPSLSDPQI